MNPLANLARHRPCTGNYDCCADEHIVSCARINIAYWESPRLATRRADIPPPDGQPTHGCTFTWPLENPNDEDIREDNKHRCYLNPDHAFEHRCYCGERHP